MTSVFSVRTNEHILGDINHQQAFRRFFTRRLTQCHTFIECLHRQRLFTLPVSAGSFFQCLLSFSCLVEKIAPIGLKHKEASIYLR